MLTVFLLSVSLALDALAVSVTEGALLREKKLPLALRLATVFGGFQSGMAFLGVFLNSLFAVFLSRIDEWLAFGIFLILGIKMIKEGLSKEEKTLGFLSWKVLLLLGLATSIDALAAGMTLNVLAVPVLLSVLTIGVVTFALCFLGTFLGVSIQKIFTRVPLEVLGGLFLIGLALQTVLL